jgi:hypothetical protein
MIMSHINTVHIITIYILRSINIILLSHKRGSTLLYKGQFEVCLCYVELEC